MSDSPHLQPRVKRVGRQSSEQDGSHHERELSDSDSNESHDVVSKSTVRRAEAKNRPSVTDNSVTNLSDNEQYVDTSPGPRRKQVRDTSPVPKSNQDRLPVRKDERDTSKNSIISRRDESMLRNGETVRTRRLINGEMSRLELEADDKMGVNKLMLQSLLSPFNDDVQSSLHDKHVGDNKADINRSNPSALPTSNGIHSSLNKHDKEKKADIDLTDSTTRDSSPVFGSQSSMRSSVSPESYSSMTMSLVHNVHMSTKDVRQRGYLVGSVSSGQSMLGSSELQRYFPERRMRIFVGTWNMGGMREAPSSVNNFLLPELIEYAQDAYIIGSQEAISNRLQWELKLQETLGPHYVLFHSGSHGTLHLAIFLRRDIIWFCSESEEATVTTRPGPSGIKTKGALGVHFKLFGTSFLFINTHFTAHDERASERIEDYKKITSGLDLPKSVYKKSDADVTTRFDYVFWLGDLNSRLQKDRYQVDRLIKGTEIDVNLCSYDDVVKHDELKMAIDAGLTFHHFQEGRIKFRPTYKYNIGTTDFDDSKKMRTPSYTDRILFRSRKKNTVACLYYDSVMSMCESDHKPVFGLFEVFIRPGVDTINLSGGQFNRAVWLQGCRQRATMLAAPGRTGGETASVSSSVCLLS